MAWTSVVAPTHGASSPLTFTPVNIGDVLWALALVSSGTATITFASAKVAGGFNYFGATTALVQSSGFSYRLGWGIVTSTGASTVTCSTTAGTIQELTAGEDTPPAGTVVQDGSQSTSNANNNSIAYPSLVPAAGGEFYLGYAVPVGSGTVGSTSGFTYSIFTTTQCITVYSLNAPNPSAPTATATGSTGWDAIAGLLTTSTGVAGQPLRPLVASQARNRAGTF